MTPAGVSTQTTQMTQTTPTPTLTLTPTPTPTPTSSGFTLEDRYLQEEGRVYLTGVQALVRLLFDRIRHDRRAGLDNAAFVSGYEGSPLAGFDLELMRRVPLLTEHGVVHRPGLNEELAATSVMGSQLAGEVGRLRTDGVVGLWYGKAPGLDRATDALRHANLVGTSPRGGALALVGDDPAAKSSSVPCASELALADLAVPIFYPADSQDILDYGLHAVELSRASGVWASMKIVANVADAAGTAVVHPVWQPPVLPSGAYTHRPDGHLLGAGLAKLEQSLHHVRLPLVQEYLRAGKVNRILNQTPDDRIGIITAGKTHLDVQQALRSLGLDDKGLARLGIRLLKLAVIHPLEPTVVREFAAGLREVIVVEEKRSFVEAAVKDTLYGITGAPSVHGKHGPDGTTLFSAVGELDPESIAAGFARRLADHGFRAPSSSSSSSPTPRPRERVSLPLLARTPYFCSGCPHNSSTKVPDGSLVGAGIGCHTMAVFMEPEQVGHVVGMTQMGGEGAQWFGMAPFLDDDHFVQNIGDGTFMHSGSLAVRAAVASGVNITYKLLYNSAVAMTGGQQPVGALPVDRVAALLLLEGAAKVIITSEAPDRLRKAVLPKGVVVRHRDHLISSQEELAATPGVTVLIHDQECAAEKRRKRRRGTVATPTTRVMINERICEGCGDCGAKSNCLSVQPVGTEFGRKTAIDQSSCNLDFSCLDGDCPSFVTVTPSGRKSGPKTPELAAADLPEPDRRDGQAGQGGQDSFTVRITGIGGTGVVTVAQILATAAVLDGKHVRTLDQTGLAQKGGAVVSDIKITSGVVAQAAKLARSECDLYLACDILVGADPKHLAAADPGRTTAVVSTTEVPTGRMVVDTEVAFPEQGPVKDAIRAASARALYLDARARSEALFGEDRFANVLQLGVAYQSGAMPLPAEAIEEAITLNGTAVQANLQAFRRGRQLVADPAAATAATTASPPSPPAVPGVTTPAVATPAVATPAVAAAVARIRSLVAAEPGTDLARLLDIRIPDLIQYQNEKYARSYALYVEQVRAREAPATAVTEAVAHHLYKLMAYKDEYEVARLALDETLRQQIAAEFGEGSRFSYRLHPPVLRALGVKRKISLGRWFRPVFRVLRAMRRLRGTPLDLFGYAHVRRVERSLVEDYRRTVARALSAVESDPGLVKELAELPDRVRGYEQIKLRNVTAYRQRQAELLAELGLTPSGTPAGS
ncbi:indolepyruvate ferredoxin oxidoreductase family protein [Streptomyces aurantiacus]|uniref:Indolepyruvate ferredoxin oxidoreductase n=1 Tax=Streptomyces aurantiacus TaxID=47760 RepID=A0A7G1NTT1_9ACTN|nr:indolepyruvate ferredoxin oxidoreductase family protein [Streptomyces aurantiacus]BCL26743.1 indolepyruvate ferredoxin oxidoreductase [Streptomyces aurantiacus]